jgi:hypothetical protein
LEFHVHPAAFKCGHWLKLNGATGFPNTLARLARKCTELRFTSTAILFNVYGDARPLAELAAQHQVDKVLDRLKALAASANQAAELFRRFR